MAGGEMEWAVSRKGRTDCRGLQKRGEFRGDGRHAVESWWTPARVVAGTRGLHRRGCGRVA